MSTFDTYLSPFTWRYASPEMREIWSEVYKHKLWRQIWVALARAESEFNLVTPEQVADLETHMHQVDMKRSLEIEAEIHHDLMAEVKTFAEQAQLGGRIIHLGATSMDIEDNADALRLRQSMQILIQKIGGILLIFADQVDRWADLPIMAFTHLQPAEPSTLGYRLAFYAQDLFEEWENLSSLSPKIRGKGFKGAVGTAASYIELIGIEQFDNFEERLSQILDLPFYKVTNQTYPRNQDYTILSALAGMGASLYKFGFDLRLLQSPMIGEVSEPFGSKQVGSSAMPFKRNPINAEKMDSLARTLAQMPATAWNNAAHSLLERTLDDSANRRSLLPEAFLTCDELLITASRIIKGLNVNLEAVQRNLNTYAPFASTERLLMALVKAGADRQEMHERLREHAMSAWEQVQRGQTNPLNELLAKDPAFHAYLAPDSIASLLTVDGYLGIAPQKAREMAHQIRQTINNR